MADLNLVTQLRKQTSAGMMDCKKALEEAGGDLTKAVEILRKQGIRLAAKKGERETGQGIIETYTHPGAKLGVLLKLVCETDFVARNEQFKELAHNLAMQIAAMNPLYIAPEDIPEEIKAKEKKIYLEQLGDDIQKKPAEIADKIIEGKMKKYYSEVCLYRQLYIKNDKITIEELIQENIAKIGENIKVVEFVRYSL